MTIVSSMGAALRCDPAMVRIGPLSAARNCPLAAMVRKRLRQRGSSVAFTCVYSIEPVTNLPEDAVGQPQEDSYSRGRKRRTLGSLPTLTGIFGLAAANTAMQKILHDDAGTQ
jgi:tRNA A37 threonylcarbamoyladenosine dehydratase